jgi:hypothetical protein
MKNILLVSLLIFSSVHCFARQGASSRLKISADGHAFVYENSKPFFWLGDTGWQMLFRLDKKEIEQYLENRKQKGFNVIQTVALDDSTDPIGPNRYGDLPLVGYNLDKPNEKYFELVDWALKLAQKKGLYVALMTTWAGNVVKYWGTPKAIFDEQKAYRYGLFLGKRYRNYPNVIWVAGGDRAAFTATTDWRPMWRNLVRGLREGAGAKVLVTYHPTGEASSTDYWKQDSTLDFNMIQSRHRTRDIPVWNWVQRDYRMEPAKPVLDAEPNYEDHPINWKKENGYFDDYEVRKQLYRTVFSGAAGVTYGDHAVWQFYSPREKPFAFPDRNWQEALDRPGAFQAGYLKKLILSRPQDSRIPEQSMVLNSVSDDPYDKYVTAFRNKENSLAMIYLPVGATVMVKISWMTGNAVGASWFDPKTGTFKKIGVYEKTNKPLSFVPPTLGSGNDWVLVLDAVKKGS